MADIVLRNRDGKEINYPGVNYINVNTPDGETQGYAAYDPETLVPENLVSGVVVGDVEGNLSVPQAVETTIDPDFSAGDMEVVPEDGKVFSKVGILKPANLTPENIAEGVNIAGIVGALAGGGGGVGSSPMLFVRTTHYVQYVYKSSYTNVDFSVSLTLPAGSVVKDILADYRTSYSTSSTSNSSESTGSVYRIGASNINDVTVSDTSSAVTVTYKESIQCYKYCSVTLTLCVMFSVPGVYIKELTDGVYKMYADSSVTTLPATAMFCHPVSVADLSESNITALPGSVFSNAQIDEIIFPSTLTSIGGYSLYGTGIKALDFSRLTSVPSLTSYSLTAHDGLEIRVPTALYDEWVAASTWSSLKSYIVAV